MDCSCTGTGTVWGAIFNEKSSELNIKQVSPKSHYKDIYRKMSGELRRFAGGDTEI